MLTGASAYYFLSPGQSDHNEVADNVSAAPAPTSTPNKAQQTPSSLGASNLNAPTISPAPTNSDSTAKTIDADTLKNKGAELTAKLNGLAVQLDKNLDSTEERKRIQAEFQLLTQEYNQLIIQLAKAERPKTQSPQTP